MLAYKVSSEQLRHPAQVQAEWQDLQSRCDCSYFQSWGWISCWLKVIALEQQVTLVRVYQGDALVGLGLFVSAEFVRRKMIRCKVMFLNEYPLAGNNMVMEYNGLLAQTGCEQAVYQHTLEHLSRQFPLIDEFHFGALSQQPAYSSLAQCEDRKSVV